MPRTPAPATSSDGGVNFALGAIGALFGLAAIAWATLGVAAVLSGHSWPSGGLSRTVSDWTHNPGHPSPVTSPVLVYAVAVVLVLIVVALVVLFCVYVLPRLRTDYARGNKDAGMATGRDLARLRVKQTEQGRITLGRVGGNLVAALREHSVLAAGATRSGKTSGLAVPVMLEWDGPLICCSTKTDLFGDTYAHRVTRGPVWVFDPTGAADLDGRNGLVTHSWNPLSYAATFTGAQKVAAAFTDASPTVKDTGSTAYWKSQADQLLAATMYAARIAGLNMGHTLQWFKRAVQPEDVGGQFTDAIHILAKAQDGGDDDARIAFESLTYVMWMEQKQRDSAIGTCRACLDVYDDPRVVANSLTTTIIPAAFLDGQARTLYLVGSRHEQHRLAPLFTAMLTFFDREVTARAERNRARRRDRKPIANESERVLFVLDEVAKLAPMEFLPDMASEIGGEGGALLTLVQDFSQLRDRYGNRWNSLVNNHPVRIALAGIADAETQRWFSDNAGRTILYDESRTRDSSGRNSTSTQARREKVMDAGAVRLQDDLTGLVIALNVPPFILQLRPWWKDKNLKRLVVPMVTDTTDPDDYESTHELPIEHPVPLAPPVLTPRVRKTAVVTDKDGTPSAATLNTALRGGAAMRVGKSKTAPIFFQGTYYAVNGERVEPITSPAQVRALDLAVAKIELAGVIQAHKDGMTDRLGEDPALPFRYGDRWYKPTAEGLVPITDTKQIKACESSLSRIAAANADVEVSSDQS